MNRPNILYMNSHDTGRYVQPYGHAAPTPNLQRLAEQGVLFRRAFSAAPTCSPSRAALVTGQCPHRNGMLGLAHRNFRRADYGRHILHTLRRVGYASTLIGTDGDGTVGTGDNAILGAQYGQRLPAADPLVTYPRMESFRSPLVPGAVGGGVITGLCEVGHQGLLYDKEFGLYHNRARMLHPTLGRFLQRDPLGYVDGMSLYVYGKSLPISRRDPGGKVVVGFRGWEGIWWLGENYSSRVIDSAIEAIKATKTQSAEAYKYGRTGLIEAMEFIQKAASRQRHNPTNKDCKEPVYVIGYSIGSRTALVLAQLLAPLERGARTRMRPGHFFELRQLFLLDYNWGASCFTPLATVDRPLHPGAPHQVPDDYIQKTSHWVSVGPMVSGGYRRRGWRNIVWHTDAVWAMWKDVRDNPNASWTDFKNYWGIRGLSNTSGAHANRPPTNLNVEPNMTWRPDHIKLGESEFAGAVLAEIIQSDYEKVRREAARR